MGRHQWIAFTRRCGELQERDQACNPKQGSMAPGATQASDTFLVLHHLNR